MSERARGRPQRSRDRAGMTLIEVLIAIVVFALVIVGALSYLQAQTRAFYRGSDRLVALQNLRFVAHRMETDVQTAGTHLVFGQPPLVYAGSDVLAFNADYATNVPNDPFAVFYDPGVPTGQVSVLAASLTIPNTSFVYGDTVYSDPQSGIRSAAELLVFYFESDTSTARTDDYRLMRQVNAGAPEVVARDLLAYPGRPFFQYLEDTAPGVDTVPASALPLTHAAAIHSGPADTGAVRRIDQVRGVRVNVRGTNGLEADLEHQADLSRVIAMHNVATKVLGTCGGTPILGSVGFSAALKTSGSDDYIEVSWSPATDESGGEQDVIRYVIWRRTGSDPVWGDPHVSLAAGQASYSWDDYGVTSGESYQYAVAVQDCTPRLSTRTLSTSITVP